VDPAVVWGATTAVAAAGIVGALLSLPRIRQDHLILPWFPARHRDCSACLQADLIVAA
jgi:hypothetical protein